MRILPQLLTLPFGAQWSFTASDGEPIQANATSWSILEGADGGTISSEGRYTAPNIAGTYRIVAARQEGRETATATVSVMPVPHSSTRESLAAMAEQIYYLKGQPKPPPDDRGSPGMDGHHGRPPSRRSGLQAL